MIATLIFNTKNIGWEMEVGGCPGTGRMAGGGQVCRTQCSHRVTLIKEGISRNMVIDCNREDWRRADKR